MGVGEERGHNERMRQVVQVVDGYEPLATDAGPKAWSMSSGPEMIAVEAGEYEIGAAATGFAYDNERRRHSVELTAFEIDRTPVSNRAYVAYMDGTGVDPPLYLVRDRQ